MGSTAYFLHSQGDVIKIAKGTTVLFNSPDSGKAFYGGHGV